MRQCERIKVEPQLHVNNDWVIYPMEARVMNATVPEHGRAAGVDAPTEVMRRYLCTTGGVERVSEPASVLSQRFRNAKQDVALAIAAPRDEIQKLFGACDAPSSPDPESYLRIRDYLLRLR